MGNSGSSSSSRYDYQPSSRSSRREEPRLPRYEDSPPSYHHNNYEQQVVPRYEQQYSRPSQAPASAAAPPPPVSKPHKKNLQRRFSRKYSVIADNYNDVEEVQQALRQAGLESSNLIVGIDFTKSNEWTGKKSFNSRSLHAIGAEMNPYEKAISIVGQTLSPFDDDNLIPCFGFGDSSTHDKHVFSFFPDHRPCEGFEEALRRYKTIVPHLRLAGPTSFAPIIEAAVDIVEQNGGQYHVLIIIADGQVTRSVDTAEGYQSPQEQATIDAIVNASSYPLSIVLVGVGDGPWDMMREFDDNLPARSFDNFQFVNFTQIMQKNLPPLQKEAQFALAALMEIPLQFNATQELGILGKTTGSAPFTKPLPPPPGVMRAERGMYPQPAPGYGGFSQSPSFNSRQIPASQPPYVPPPPITPAYSTYSDYGGGYNNYSGYPPSAPATDDRSTRSSVEELGRADYCPICLTDKKDMAFNCGHQTCRQCGDSLANCPICRQAITTRIRLY